MSSLHTPRAYIPAAGRHWLLRFYDPLTKLIGAQSAHRSLIDQAQPHAGQRILEIGCGTGNLAILLKTLFPEVEVIGLDPDSKALALARRKADQRRLSIQLDVGFADELPYADASFDRVFSAFMFHHLNPEERKTTLHEVNRVLKPGGALHLLDFGGAHEHSEGFLGHLTQHSAHAHTHARGNTRDETLNLMRECGLADAAEVAQQSTLLGRVCFYRASR